MIRPCTSHDVEAVYEIINAGARVYQGVIPPDRWKEPYMSREELDRELAAGVRFSGYEADGRLLGIMGTQDVQDVTLVRHAYVRPDIQRSGIGGALLRILTQGASRPILIGTWAASDWAIRFYEKHGFRLVEPEEKSRLLRTYWTIPDRQIETSVVLADPKWLHGN